MKKINSRLLSFLILICFFLTSCQSIKDGLSGRKSENSDEFLVQKKNPLVMPPDFIDISYMGYHWFVFNVADIFISLGIICLIFAELLNYKKKNEN